MNTNNEDALVDESIQASFRPEVSFRRASGSSEPEKLVIHVATLPAGSSDPPHLDAHHLPYLVIPEDRPEAVGGGQLALVAVEGRDHHMARAIASLLEPQVNVGLMHVTWLPITIDSPLGEGGLNDPNANELLIYRGAREALIDSANALRESGFEVSTHLREGRDPAQILADTIRRQQPDLFILGLGRHGAGIGRRVLEEARVPVLFVNAR
jgi:nucleotide-binding universal stress UspA family protein